MAFGGGPSGGGGVNVLFSANNKTSLSSWTSAQGLSYAGSASVDDLCIARIVSDNIATTTGTSTTHTGLTDSAGNTYTKVYEYTKATSAAGDGVTVSLWYCILTNAVTGGSTTLTASFSAATVAKGAEGYKFTRGAGNTISIDGTVQVTTTSSGGTLTISDLSNVEHLVFDIVGYENGSASTFTQTGWDASNDQGTSGSSGATNVRSKALDKVAAASTSISSTPTSGVGGDYLRFLIAFKEDVVGAGAGAPPFGNPDPMLTLLTM